MIANRTNMVSIIVPTLNTEQDLPGLVTGLMKQTVVPKEIILVDSSSQDDTVNIARQLGCRVYVIPRNEFDHGGTRNYGASFATGDILVFMTQDALPSNQYFLENLIAPLDDASVVASFGRQVAQPDATPIERFTREFNYPPHTIIKSKESLPVLGIKTFFFSDVCSAIRKDTFEEAGRYPEKIIMNEDMIIAAKMILTGYRIAYAGDAEVLHSHNYNAAQQFRRNFDIGVSHNQNRWLLDYARAEGEGYRYVKALFVYLVKGGYINQIPNAILITMAKYAGYMLGIRDHTIPPFFKKKLSMHNQYWENRVNGPNLNQRD